jgi:hypothetical protein
METTTTQCKTRREWVDICKITQPEIGQAWENELNNQNGIWDSVSPNMADSLEKSCGFWWDDSIKGLDYWTKIHKDMIDNPSNYETILQAGVSIDYDIHYWVKNIDSNIFSSLLTKGRYYIHTCFDGHGLPLHKIIEPTNGVALIETNDYLFAVRECDKLNNVLYPSPPAPSEPTKINKTLIEIFRELKEGRSERSQQYLQKLIEELERWESGL